MFQTDISIAKDYDVTNILERELIKNTIRYTVAKDVNRTIFSIADNINRDKIYNILSNILLVHMKYQYFLKKLGKCECNAEKLLLGEMIFFDSKYEHDQLDGILSLQYEYSLDGILNFKMKDIRENWDYLITLYTRVRDDMNAMMMLAEYIHDSAIDMDKKIYITTKRNKIVMFDISSGESVVNSGLGRTIDDNLLYMITSAHSNELYVDKRCRFNILSDIISKIVTIKYV